MRAPGLAALAALAALAVVAAACGQRVAIGGNGPDEPDAGPPPPPPCAGLPCGAPCSVSGCGDPNAGCAAPDFAGTCDAFGACSAAFPVCDDCAGKPCGEPCAFLCPDGAPDCPTPEPAACDGLGQCLAGPIACPPCTPETCPPADPCAGLLCGAVCDPCVTDPGGCDPPPLGPFGCDDTGACVLSVGLACPSTYQPCAGKACGDVCSICEPGFPCEMPPEAYACDADGVCLVGTVICN